MHAERTPLPGILDGAGVLDPSLSFKNVEFSRVLVCFTPSLGWVAGDGPGVGRTKQLEAFGASEATESLEEHVWAHQSLGGQPPTQPL